MVEVLEASIERQAPERTEYPLEVDYQELAGYAHNPRCYYWSSWLGLRPPINQKELFERVFRENLRAGYDGNEAHQHIAYTNPSEWRNASRLKQAISSYGRSYEAWGLLGGPKYFSRPLGSTLSYGGLLDASVLVKRVLWFVIHKISEHRTDSDAFVNRFKGSPEMVGAHWLGQHAFRLMKLPTGTSYGGIILDGIQMTKTIDRRITTYLIPTPWQIEQFVRNAYMMGEEIIRRRELTRKYVEAKEPARNAWPNWPSHGEHFCQWKALNVADSIETEENFLETCTADPWWVRRDGKEQGAYR